MRVIGSGTAIASQAFGRGDLLRILQAIEQSTTSALAAGDGDGYTEGYRDGHQAALAAIALAVGVELPTTAAWHVVDTERAARVLERRNTK